MMGTKLWMNIISCVGICSHLRVFCFDLFQSPTFLVKIGGRTNDTNSNNYTRLKPDFQLYSELSREHISDHGMVIQCRTIHDANLSSVPYRGHLEESTYNLVWTTEPTTNITHTFICDVNDSSNHVMADVYRCIFACLDAIGEWLFFVNYFVALYTFCIASVLWAYLLTACYHI